MAHTGMQDLPVEIVLKILSSLPLKALIASRGVCSHWRSLLSAESPDIPLVRRRLLGLYLKLIDSPAFYASRPYIIPHLQAFEREVYMACLPASISGDAPELEEFRTWLLEWPGRAVFCWMWPALPLLCHKEPIFPDITRHGSRNALLEYDVVRRQVARPDDSETATGSSTTHGADSTQNDTGTVEIQTLRLTAHTVHANRTWPSLGHLDLVTSASHGFAKGVGAVVYWEDFYVDPVVVAWSWINYLELELEKQEQEVTDDPLIPWDELLETMET